MRNTQTKPKMTKPTSFSSFAASSSQLSTSKKESMLSSVQLPRTSFGEITEDDDIEYAPITKGIKKIVCESVRTFIITNIQLCTYLGTYVDIQVYAYVLVCI